MNKIYIISLCLILQGCQPHKSVKLDKADTVIINAAIYTLDKDQPWVEAIAMQKGKYVYVGNELGVKSFIGENTKLINAQGEMIMPGIIDGHIHTILGGMKDLFECNFPFSASLQQISKKISGCVTDNPKAKWIVGGQWASGLFDNNLTISPRIFLDKVSGNKAIILGDDTTHDAWVNSKALTLAGINNDSKNPTGGEFVRDRKTGELNGVVLEAAAKYMNKFVPQRRDDEYQRAIKHVVQLAYRYGITGMKDAGVPLMGLKAFHDLDLHNELKMHMALSIRAPNGPRMEALDYDKIDRLRDAYKSQNVNTNFIKIFMDGIPTSSHTAAMLSPYQAQQGDEPTRGKANLSEALLSKDLIELDKRGYTLKIHTAGDAAVRISLNAIERARQKNGFSGQRHELAHAGFVSKSDLVRFSPLKVTIDLSPYIWFPSPLLDAINSAVAVNLKNKYWPIRDFINEKIHLMAGSDWPSVAPSMNPFPGIEALITRKNPYKDDSETLWLEQQISLAEALKIFTLGGAEALTLSHKIGSIEVGKQADFIMLNQNLFKVKAESISDTQVLKTFFNGDLVFEK